MKIPSFFHMFLILLILSTLGALVTQDLSSIQEAVEFSTSDGIMLGGIFYTPQNKEGPFPTVIAVHGISLNQKYLTTIASEFSRNGFAVLTFDIRGHGNSGGHLNKDAIHDVKTALSYLRTRPDVNNSQIMLLGHSLGGKLVLRVAVEDPGILATIVIGSQAENVTLTSDNPNNLLIAVGRADEFVSEDYAKDMLFNSTNHELSTPDILWGSFEEKNARKLVFVYSNHIFEVINREIIKESISWSNSAIGKEEKNISLTPIWIHSFLYIGIIASIGVSLSYFNNYSLKKEEEEYSLDELELKYARKIRRIYRVGLILAISLITPLVLNLFNQIVGRHFEQVFTFLYLGPLIFLFFTYSLLMVGTFIGFYLWRPKAEELNRNVLQQLSLKETMQGLWIAFVFILPIAIFSSISWLDLIFTPSRLLLFSMNFAIVAVFSITLELIIPLGEEKFFWLNEDEKGHPWYHQVSIKDFTYYSIAKILVYVPMGFAALDLLKIDEYRFVIVIFFPILAVIQVFFSIISL
ncbi:MAG: alpha/beta fold hydrolase, partial [Candidatus Heimdallarchaeota archaeon]|nr:alpha/beta fold hydrolase [Candidatus Heimdallarchaeota archaeon]MCK5049170.1 alpha/beta fold hydrolase [Candidatus Heimdallarchaeota archaeon]